MYIYHALIDALSAHTIHINLNTIFYTHMHVCMLSHIQVQSYPLRLWQRHSAFGVSMMEKLINTQGS